MTVVCGGGTSGPKAGVNETIIATSAFLAELLTGTPAWWVAPALSLLAVTTYDLSTACLTDPPAMPTLTAAEATAILGLIPGADLTSALSKLPDLVANTLWYANCQCTGGPQPAAAPLPNAPSAAVNAGTRLMRGDQTTTALQTLFCTGADLQADVAQHVYGIVDSVLADVLLTGVRAWGIRTADVTELGVWKNHQLLWRSGTVTLTYQQPNDLAIPPTVVVPGDQVTVARVGAPAGVTMCQNVAGCSGPGADPTWLNGTIVDAASTSLVEPTAIDNQRDLFLNLWYTTNPAALASAQCCPDYGTTPDLSPVLKRIADLDTSIQGIQSLLHDLQRFGQPFAYIVGAVHAALTGSGTIAISRLVGLRVEVTAFPPTNRTSFGTPTYVYDLGWLSVQDADGMVDEIRITRTTQVWSSRLTPLATICGYYFREGVTGTITELQAEP